MSSFISVELSCIYTTVGPEDSVSPHTGPQFGVSIVLLMGYAGCILSGFSAVPEKIASAFIFTHSKVTRFLRRNPRTFSVQTRKHLENSVIFLSL